ncbi:hypothetical protein J437_LFUL012026 [Ladona fulva]|uniref:Major facilitator superfamily (MFS) profile domain-containing protein n=1 Tax=Ladona fulva TaxID=123851 RepID=A0A8K0KG76_LADFU|nr:hypothetical protein J437_LFUL012026 [Ladona fulva]
MYEKIGDRDLAENKRKMWLKKRDPVDGESSSEPSTLKIAFIQVLATIVANFPAISPGMSLGFSAIALPQMLREASLDTEQSSWIASVASVTTPIGCLLAGALCEKLGRRGALLAVNIPCFIGWLLIAFVPQTTSPGGILGGGGSAPMALLYTGRALTGLATGMSSAPGPIMVGEISSPKLRGMLVCWNSVAISLGVLLVYMLGAFLPWRLVAGLSASFPVLSAILLMTMPESPVWLLTKGRVDEARRALTFYRAGHVAVANAEFAEALGAAAARSRENCRRPSAMSTLSTSFSSYSHSFLAAMMRPEVYKPLIIMNGFFLFQQFSGTFVVVFYAVEIVKEAGIVGIDPFLATVFIGLVRLLVCIGVSLGMRKHGRRPPAIISGAGMTVTMAALAIYLTVKRSSQQPAEEDPLLILGNNTNTSESFETKGTGSAADSWLPAVALLGYIGLGTIGFLTLPWAMLGEVFPSSVRGPASGATSAIAYFLSFASIKAYPGLKSAIGSHGVFFVFGVFSLLGTMFVAAWLPETHGRTLSGIEKDFAEGSCWQLCRRKKVNRRPENLRTPTDSANTTANMLSPREMVSVVMDHDVNNDENGFESTNLRTDEPAEDERNKLTV